MPGWEEGFDNLTGGGGNPPPPTTPTSSSWEQGFNDLTSGGASPSPSSEQKTAAPDTRPPWEQAFDFGKQAKAAGDWLGGLVQSDKPVWEKGLDVVGKGAEGLNWWFENVSPQILAKGASAGLSAVGETDAANPKMAEEDPYGYWNKVAKERLPFEGAVTKGMLEMAVDPTTYVGLGVAGKLPVVGKVLGPVENAVSRGLGLPVELPLRAAGAVAKATPGLNWLFKLSKPSELRAYENTAQDALTRWMEAGKTTDDVVKVANGDLAPLADMDSGTATFFRDTARDIAGYTKKLEGDAKRIDKFKATWAELHPEDADIIAAATDRASVEALAAQYGSSAEKRSITKIFDQHGDVLTNPNDLSGVMGELSKNKAQELGIKPPSLLSREFTNAQRILKQAWLSSPSYYAMNLPDNIMHLTIGGSSLMWPKSVEKLANEAGILIPTDLRKAGLLSTMLDTVGSREAQGLEKIPVLGGLLKTGRLLNSDYIEGAPRLSAFWKGASDYLVKREGSYLKQLRQGMLSGGIAPEVVDAIISAIKARPNRSATDIGEIVRSFAVANPHIPLSVAAPAELTSEPLWNELARQLDALDIADPQIIDKVNAIMSQAERQISQRGKQIRDIPDITDQFIAAAKGDTRWGAIVKDIAEATKAGNGEQAKQMWSAAIYAKTLMDTLRDAAQTRIRVSKLTAHDTEVWRQIKDAQNQRLTSILDGLEMTVKNMPTPVIPETAYLSQSYPRDTALKAITEAKNAIAMQNAAAYAKAETLLEKANRLKLRYRKQHQGRPMPESTPNLLRINDEIANTWKEAHKQAQHLGTDASKKITKAMETSLMAEFPTEYRVVFKNEPMKAELQGRYGAVETKPTALSPTEEARQGMRFNEPFTGDKAKSLENALWDAQQRGASPQEIEAIRKSYMSTEALPDIAKGKISAKTGFTKGQEQFLAGELEKVAPTLKGPGQVGEPFSIKVPGDGTVTVSDQQQAQNLHNFLTGKPIKDIEGQPTRITMEQGPKRQWSSRTTDELTDQIVGVYGSPEQAWAAIRRQVDWLEALPDEQLPSVAKNVDMQRVNEIKNKLEHQLGLPTSDDLSPIYKDMRYIREQMGEIQKKYKGVERQPFNENATGRTTRGQNFDKQMVYWEKQLAPLEAQRTEVENAIQRVSEARTLEDLARIKGQPIPSAAQATKSEMPSLAREGVSVPGAPRAEQAATGTELPAAAEVAAPTSSAAIESDIVALPDISRPIKLRLNTLADKKGLTVGMLKDPQKGLPSIMGGGSDVAFDYASIQARQDWGDPHLRGNWNKIASFIDDTWGVTRRRNQAPISNPALTPPEPIKVNSEILKQGAPEAAGAKQTWEMTKEEWANTDVGLGAEQRPVRYLFHRQEVEQALSEGKYQDAIANGRMTADEAKSIIEGAGLKVSDDLAAKAPVVPSEVPPVAAEKGIGASGEVGDVVTPPGTRYAPNLTAEAQALPDGTIEVGPKFFELSGVAKQKVLAHEQAHVAKLDDAAFDDPEFWRLVQQEDMFGPLNPVTGEIQRGINGQFKPGENVVEGYVVLMEEPAWLKANYPKAYDYIGELAQKHNLPVPDEWMREHPTTLSSLAPASAVAKPPSEVPLPKRLSGAKPQYNIGVTPYYPVFESDIDKALFIVAQIKPSRQDGLYLEYLRGVMPDKTELEIRQFGRQLRAFIGQQAKQKGGGGNLDIPSWASKNITIKEVAPPLSAVPPTPIEPPMAISPARVSEIPIETPESKAAWDALQGVPTEAPAGAGGNVPPSKPPVEIPPSSGGGNVPPVKPPTGASAGATSPVPEGIDIPDITKILDENIEKAALARREAERIAAEQEQRNMALLAQYKANALQAIQNGMPVLSQTAAQRAAIARAELQAVKDWRQIAADASHAGDEKQKRDLFDYASRSNFDELMLKVSPFVIWQTRNIPWYLQEMLRKPVLANTYMKYQRESDRQQKERNLTSRFEGQTAIGPLDKVASWATGVPGSMMYGNPLNTIMSIGQQLKTPYEAEGESGAGRAINVAKQAVGGVSLYPWFQLPLQAAGVFGNTPYSDIIPESRVVRAVSGMAGNRVDPEAFWKDRMTKLQGQPTVGTSTIEDYYISKKLSEMVQSGDITQAQAMRAMDNDKDPLWKQAQTAVQGEADKMGLLRFFLPTTMKALNPQEAAIRAAKGEMPPYSATPTPEDAAKRSAIYNANPGLTAMGAIQDSPEKRVILAQQSEYYALPEKSAARRAFLVDPANKELADFFHADTESKNEAALDEYLKSKGIPVGRNESILTTQNGSQNATQPAAVRTSTAVATPSAATLTPETAAMAQQRQTLLGSLDAYYAIGDENVKTLNDKYLSIPKGAERTAWQRTNPQEFKTLQSYWNQRDQMKTSDPLLAAYLDWASMNRDFPEGQSKTDAFLKQYTTSSLTTTGNRQPLSPVTTSAIPRANTSGYTSYPRSSGGGGGGGYSSGGSSGSSSQAAWQSFERSAGPQLVSELEAHWQGNAPISAEGTAFLQTMFAKDPMGAKDLNDYIERVLRGKWLAKGTRATMPLWMLKALGYKY